MKKALAVLVLCIGFGSLLWAASYNTVSVTSSATVILPASRSRAAWAIHNVSTNTVYIGFDANITSANSLPLLTGEKILNDGNTAWRGTMYGIVTSGTAAMEVRYLEWGLGDLPQ